MSFLKRINKNFSFPIKNGKYILDVTFDNGLLAVEFYESAFVFSKKPYLKLNINFAQPDPVYH